MRFKHQPGLFQKTTEKAWVLSQEPHFKNRKDTQFVENEDNDFFVALMSYSQLLLRNFTIWRHFRNGLFYFPIVLFMQNNCYGLNQ